jgi:glutamate/tyrosine decarboxylase-like PLP-dependent enzyme
MDDMKHQIFVATEFPGGIYASPTMIGTRPGGPIAAAWASLHALGDEGYLALTRQAVDAADRFRAGIAAIPELALVGRPDATIVCYRASGKASPGSAGARSGAQRREVSIDVYAIADRMEARGWTIDRQHRPPTIHLTVTANHAQAVEAYVTDLRAAVEEVRTNPALAKSGSAPMYGMAGKMPVRFMVKRQVRALIAKMYSGGAPS